MKLMIPDSVTEKSNAQRTKRLLIVDDEPGPRESLKMIFQGDFDVTLADSGEKAVELAAKTSFDVVVTDIRMDGISGIDVLRELKRINKFTEVIVLTAYETVKTAREAISLGAADYLRKPFDIDHIINVVKRASDTSLKNQEEESATLYRSENPDFLEMVSNEISAPKNGILGFLEMLEGTELTAAQAEYVQSIKNSNQNYFEYTQDILDYAKCTSGDGEVSNETFNPATMVIKSLKAARPGRQIDLHAILPENLPTAVTGNEHEIQILVRKLLRNAILSSPDGEVRISIAYTPSDVDAGDLEFTVYDDGPGIDSGDFQKMRMLDMIGEPKLSLKSAHAGVEIGMALAKMVSKRINAGLKVESEPGQGTTCSFTVPVKVVD